MANVIDKVAGHVVGPQGPQGPQGPKGDTGQTGPQGATGATGATPNLTIGTVATLEPDSQATATITGTAENPVLNLGLPKGRTGEVSQAEFDEVAGDVSQLKSELDTLVYRKTLSGTNGYYSYFPVEIIVGDVYKITNNTSGTGVVESVNDNNQRVETFIPNINPNETVSFTPTLEASKLRIWFNASGTYTLVNTNKIIPELQKSVDDAEADLSALETTVSDNATATEIITVTSKNLLNPADLTITGQYYGDASGGHTSDAAYKSFANLIEVEPSTPYVFSVNGSTNVVFVTLVELDSDKSKVSGGYNQPSVFTTKSTTKYLRLSIDANYANQQIQLEKGTSPTSYEPYATTYETTQTRIDLDALATVANGLKGRKICSFGDSLAAGDNGNRADNTWIKIVANYFGATPYNRGIGSSCVTNETSAGVARTGFAYVNSDGDAGQIRGLYPTAQSFANYPNSISPWMCDIDRANTIPTDTDIVIIIAGTNDIGTVTVEGFKTAYRQMLNNIMVRVPNAKIFPCTMPFQQTYDSGTDADKAVYNSYRTAIKDISSEYGFEYIDLRTEMGVNAQNYSTYMSDATHYATYAGKRKMAQCICKHIRNACFIE